MTQFDQVRHHNGERAWTGDPWKVLKIDAAAPYSLPTPLVSTWS